MSGGVGPTSDISLPQEHHHHDQQETISKKPISRHRPGFTTFRQLNVLAIAVILSASGMVAVEDFAFVVFSIIYMYVFAKFAFPPSSPNPTPPLFGENTSMFSLFSIYAFAGAVIGLFLPIAYILEGIFEGDREGIKEAVPHVFLLASQVLMEGLFGGSFSEPIRVLVPVFFNARRCLTIMDWVRNEMLFKDRHHHGGNEMRLYVGRVLAVANMAFWSLNLFVFLLPFYLPKAFKAYYGVKTNKD